MNSDKVTIKAVPHNVKTRNCIGCMFDSMEDCTPAPWIMEDKMGLPGCKEGFIYVKDEKE